MVNWVSVIPQVDFVILCNPHRHEDHALLGHVLAQVVSAFGTLQAMLGSYIQHNIGQIVPSQMFTQPREANVSQYTTGFGHYS